MKKVNKMKALAKSAGVIDSLKRFKAKESAARIEVLAFRVAIVLAGIWGVVFSTWLSLALWGS